MSAEPTPLRGRAAGMTASLHRLRKMQEQVNAAVRRAAAAMDAYAVAEHPDLADLNLHLNNIYPAAFDGD